MRLVLLFIILTFIVGVSAQGAPVERPAGSSPYEGRKVREIRIDLHEVFDDPDLSWFYRSVNSLKINTREEVIRRELLIKEGDLFNHFTVEESERNIRALPFLRNAAISVQPIGEEVILTVRVQETWTLVPRVSLSSGSGNNRKSVGVSDTNLLGSGKRLDGYYSDDEGREKIEGVWDDNRLFGTYQRLLVGAFTRSDGHRTTLYYGMPFRTLLQPEGWAVSGEEIDLVGRLFSEGEERYIFREKVQELGGGYTISSGEAEERLRRLTIGYDFSNYKFSDADAQDYADVNVDPNSVSHDPDMLAPDRRFSGPSIAFEQVKQEYISARYIDRFERVEDYNLGNEFNAKLWYAAGALSSDEDTLIGAASVSEGIALSPSSFMRGEIIESSRFDFGSFHNSILHIAGRYYNVIGPLYSDGVFLGSHTLAAGISLDYADSLDKDREFLLGASNGLRGYQDRTFTGDSRLVLNLEDRVTIAEDVLKLFNVGAAAFVDAGGSTYEAPGKLFGEKLYSDVGVGLRIGFPRSSGGGVVRIDLAFPLRDGPDGSMQYEPRILFTGGQVFSSKLISGSLAPRPQVLEVGVD